MCTLAATPIKSIRLIVKRDSAIEFVESYKSIGKGFGGKNEDGYSDR